MVYYYNYGFIIKLYKITIVIYYYYWYGLYPQRKG